MTEHVEEIVPVFVQDTEDYPTDGLAFGEFPQEAPKKAKPVAILDEFEDENEF